MEILSVNNVTVVRDGNPIISNLNWSVQEGQHWIIMGPNGAGKTTLVSLLTGLMFPTSGSVTVLGEQLGKTNVRELRTRIGLSSAALANVMPPRETVFDAVLTAAHGVTGRWRERYGAQDEDRAHFMLNEWGITHLSHRIIGTLSEGERKRVQIARALMADPEMLILDEPAAGLDVAGREDLIVRLSTLAANPMAPALILVTHHVEEIPPNFTDALLLSHGSVSARGPISDIIASGPMSQAFEYPLWVEYGDDRWYARGRGESKGRRARKDY